MRFSEAKKLNENEEVFVIEKGGKNPRYRAERVTEVSVEDKDAFIRCSDGRLYHHTALKRSDK